ncbi:transcription factor MYB1R1-like [Nicotiana tabacum]|uniref:Transcription factor MYB1R1-like n=2 Tax=Nicotiana TaxID=4085 RepID=A0A1S4AZ37_TOBAC|nr:PREDICTED: transcription factor MYB1R1-like [Nicotiana sylvestris]XP_016481927.1 PREDICTED: transcription factor MYB1R1-like [Nicotiana tabacum]
MTKDARKCSHCGQNGHNSRTCNYNSKGIKLFGVRIDDTTNNNHHGDTKMKMKIGDHESAIRRSKSLGNLEIHDHNAVLDSGYLSDGPRNRKKGTSWTEEEHRSFLIGLEKLGKGDWRGISKSYVPTRTPSQVASHAQKYFIRIASNDKKKRRPSVFDVNLKDSISQIPSETYSSSPSISKNMVPEVQKEASAPLEQLFDTCQIKGQAAPCARPPLSPMTRPLGVPDLRRMPCMMGVPRGLTAAKVIAPTVSWVPVFNFPPNQSHLNYRFAPFVARPPTAGLLSHPPPHSQVQSQPGHSTPVTNNDGLNICIGAL